jgi:hypothetical protein
MVLPSISTAFSIDSTVSPVVVLTANVKTLKFVKPQRVSIKVDGKEIGMWEIGSAWKWEKHSIVIEPDEHRRM